MSAHDQRQPPRLTTPAPRGLERRQGTGENPGQFGCWPITRPSPVLARHTDCCGHIRGARSVTARGPCCLGGQPHRAATVPRMPSRRGLRSRPCDYLSPSGVWPDGPFDADTPREAFFAAGVAQRLRELCDEESARGVTVTAVAERANLSTQTVFNLLQGTTWGDLPSIYRLEVALGATLWHNPDIGRPPPD